MKVLLMFPVDGLSGAVGGPGGLTLMKNQKLCIARLTVVPANPDTTNQQFVRGAMSASAIGYQSCTAQQVLDWRAFAEINKSPIFGEDFVRGPIAEYVGVNMIRLIAGEAISPVAATAKCDFSITGISVVTIGAVNLTVTFTHTATVVTDKSVLVKLTPTLPSAVREPRPTDYRCIADVNDPTSIPALTATPQSAIWPLADVYDLPAIDDYVGIQIIPVSAEYVTGVPYATKIQATAE